MSDLRVRVQPRARRSELGEVRAGALVVRVAAPPVEGKANAAVCALLAERAGVSRSRVSVLRGERGREKVVRVEGVEREALRAALQLAPGDDPLL